MGEERFLIMGMGAAPVPAVGFASVAIQQTVFNHGLRNGDPTLLDEHFYTGASPPVMCGSTIAFVTATFSAAVPQIGVDVVGITG